MKVSEKIAKLENDIHHLETIIPETRDRDELIARKDHLARLKYELSEYRMCPDNDEIISHIIDGSIITMS